MLGSVPFLITATDSERVVLRMVTPCCSDKLFWLDEDNAYGCEACDVDYPVSTSYAASAPRGIVFHSEGVLAALDAWAIDPLTAAMLEAEARAHLAALRAPQRSGRAVKATNDPELVSRVCLVLAGELRGEVEYGK